LAAESTEDSLMNRGLPSLAALLLLSPLNLGSAATPTPAEQDFERHVRPLLVEHCQKCHGDKKQMGGLRLDSRKALLEGGDNGAAIKPGDPENSRLIQAIRHVGDLKMPPRKKLPASSVAILAAWIKAGAPWPAPGPVVSRKDVRKRHWAFQPVRRPSLPAVRNATFARNPIDVFVLSRLEAKGLSSSPEADKRTLLRRLSFDLIGLPPTPEEVDAFVTDTRPDAYERLVDRLLADPRYGERWARYWLDLARFADTKGYVFFEEANQPWAYTYRDYVIEAFNHDLPYDRFLLEQLAGDQLPVKDKDRRHLRALGFLSLGGRFMNNVHDILDDRIDVVTRGLMGLTVSCARCHDHKFDPVPTADYYSLYGVFASSVEPGVPPLFAEPPPTPLYESFRKELALREQKLADYLQSKFDDLRLSARTRVAEYLLAVHARRGQPKADEFMLLADPNDINPSMTIRWQAYLERTARSHHPVFSPWHAFAALPEKSFASLSKEVMPRLLADRGKPLNQLVIKALSDKPVASMADLAQRYSVLLNTIDQRWRLARALADRLKQPAPNQLADPHEEELRQVFHGPQAAPNITRSLFSELQLLPDRAAQGVLQNLRKAVEQWRATGAGAPPRAMVLVDVPRPYEPVVFRRGNPSNPGERVPRRFLGALSGQDRKPFARGSGRLELARAIADTKNPLTARVLVNRLWLHHFGRGLVTTPGDFGLRSDPPSHPELLDWLASEFVRSVWSRKHLHRLMVTSATYRQASVDRPTCRTLDVDNTFLWRMNRKRLELEPTRDALLAVSGQLDTQIGGPSVRDALNPGGRRRTVYTWIDRIQVPGLFRAFDFPSPDASSPNRDTTTVPQQALFLMNSPFVLHSARGLLARPEIAGERTVEGRVRKMYRLCYGRDPDADERELARAFVGEGSAASWQRYAQALLLGNEFVFVD
jgi:hypothetical protein